MSLELAETVKHITNMDDTKADLDILRNSQACVWAVQFLATREEVVPLENHPIMWRRLIQPFKHLNL